ncbi:pyridoxamine 5'-phosphate oxidase [Ferruginivarius sediminum]|uniref:Pyridoxine/pyridoxamine 5'-phosphate oxidase n=2 Tax=Ferruginivarius sediminum TaxID=2661937 RepID=A0A369TB61_9PROT|nr:pyridoxamine 5'-phosphate oxidase [Ferruginivarius sediminum]RDD62549.1 pyridoxamine 5'-phosphate oxidase [Ferruginivarius sediminum]
MFADKPPENPVDLLREWYKEAEASEPNDPNAIALATVGEDGMPSVRMVLLKDFDEKGFVFYTNLESRKGTQLTNHPKAAFVMHWKSLERQVRVEGHTQPVTTEEADTYFHSRARGSQIGAWASKQSRPLESRYELEKRVARYGAKFHVGRVPRPEHWSGFRIAPTRIEFWQSGRFRLHDRLLYLRQGDGWVTQWLYP